MHLHSCQEAVNAFATPGQQFRVEPVTGGLINHSYKITDQQTGQSFLLQQINQQVFPAPEKIQQNYLLLQQYIRELQIPFFIPELILFPGNRSLYTDAQQQCWRVFSFIDNTRMISCTENSQQAADVAEIFARLTATFNKLDCHKLHITIPGFHHVRNRYTQFTAALEKSSPERAEKSADLIRGLITRERYARLFDSFTNSPDFPFRVMHHDAKISNVLFDSETGKVVCPVDFDTVMPGYFFSDLGDMIRSMAGSADENSTVYEGLVIRPEIYESIISGYTRGMNEFLTGAEHNYLHASGLLLIYMQALRFLSDYLQDDIYYRISYPGQNYDRARNQFVLLNRLEEFLADTYKFTC
jgi:thiamine kinase-like enzyme